MFDPFPESAAFVKCEELGSDCILKRSRCCAGDCVEGTCTGTKMRSVMAVLMPSVRRLAKKEKRAVLAYPQVPCQHSQRIWVGPHHGPKRWSSFWLLWSSMEHYGALRSSMKLHGSQRYQLPHLRCDCAAKHI